MAASAAPASASGLAPVSTASLQPLLDEAVRRWPLGRDPALAAALRSSARDADSIVIRGYTDSAVADGANQRVAAGRAASAKRWLVANGIDPARIQTRYKGGGSFLADNNTDSGRALNRRVEVELRGAGDAAVTALQMKGSQP